MTQLDKFNSRFEFIDESLLGSLGRLGIAAVLIGKRGQMLHINRAAFMLIYESRGDALQLRGDPFTARTVQDMLGDMFGGAELDLPGRPRRLAFQAVNLPANGETCRLVVLIDLVAHVAPHEPALEKIFGLTAAEGRLAAELSRGVPLAAIAAGRNVSVSTLRTQLASIFEKTRTSRQPELVALLSRLAQFSTATNLAV